MKGGLGPGSLNSVSLAFSSDSSSQPHVLDNYLTLAGGLSKIVSPKNAVLSISSDFFDSETQ